MRGYFLFLCLVQLSSSCLKMDRCTDEELDHSDLVCNGTSNVVKARINWIIQDIPTRDEVQDQVNEEMYWYFQRLTEEFEEKWRGVEGAPMDMVYDFSYWDGRVDQIFKSWEKVVAVEVEKVWGSGGIEVGEEFELVSHNDFQNCGVAMFLNMDSTFLFSMDQDEILLGPKKVELCDLIDWHHKFYPSGGEEYFDAVTC